MVTRRYKKSFLGDLEQMILLAILRLDDGAHALDVAHVLEESAGRSVSRGALYTTLNRLEKKGLVSWSVGAESSTVEGRDGAPKRCFQLTEAGLEALRLTQEALSNLTAGLEGTLAGGSR